jgi:twitching motility protein PilJ
MDKQLPTFDIQDFNESPRRPQADSGVANSGTPSGTSYSSQNVQESSLVTSPNSPKRVSVSRESTSFQDIPVGQKLALIALTLSLPIALLLFFLVQRDNATIAFTAKERRGVEYLQPLAQLMETLQLHRGRSTTELAGDPSAREPRLQLIGEIDTAFATLQQLDGRLGEELDTTTQLRSLQNGWNELKRVHDSLDPPRSLERHTALIEQATNLIRRVGDTSNLVLDPDLDSYYLMSLSVVQLPRAITATGIVRTLSIQAAGRGTNDAVQRATLRGAFNVSVQELERLNDDIRSAYQANPQLARQLDQAYVTMNTEMSKFVRLVYGTILPAEQIVGLTPGQAFEVARASFDAQYDFYYAVTAQLDTLLTQRIARVRQNTLYTLLGIAGALLLAFALIAFITRQITRPLTELGRVSELVGRGDLSQVANVESRDEIGTLASSFNNAIVQLRDANARQDIELQRSQQLQNNIGEFLNVAMDIAQGDFTKRGQVSEDALGNVVDAINFMTEELGYVLKDVQNATESVTQGATDMFGTADSIARNAQAQAQEAQKARSEVQVVTSSIRQMAQTAGSSAQAAQRTLAASQEGRQAVTATLAEMQNIRREVQTVAKRVQGLSERSLEISEIVETISKIAKQTNLLALNAALEASSAGDAGARFATVAGEVRTLAENTTASVQRVSSLIKSVQDEVQEVLVGVETGNRQVEGGYKVAQQAGERLEEIATIAQQTAQFAQEISSVTREQVSRVEGVGQVVESMAEISEASQVTVSQGREAAQRLQALANELSSSIARFRIA